MAYERTIDGEESTLVTVGELATILGVGTSTVGMWAQRRPGNGFPAPVDTLTAANGLQAAHYDLDAVRVWRIYYVPDKGKAQRKLGPTVAAEIRTRYAAGGCSCRSLAAEYGVSHAAVARQVATTTAVG